MEKSGMILMWVVELGAIRPIVSCPSESELFLFLVLASDLRKRPLILKGHWPGENRSYVVRPATGFDRQIKVDVLIAPCRVTGSNAARREPVAFPPLLRRPHNARALPHSFHSHTLRSAARPFNLPLRLFCLR